MTLCLLIKPYHFYQIDELTLKGVQVRMSKNEQSQPLKTPSKKVAKRTKKRALEAEDDPMLILAMFDD